MAGSSADDVRISTEHAYFTVEGTSESFYPVDGSWTAFWGKSYPQAEGALCFDLTNLDLALLKSTPITIHMVGVLSLNRQALDLGTIMLTGLQADTADYAF
jgi:hypothetical protein